LKELLDLKQKHANIYEARSAVNRTEESNDILEATKKLALESTQILKATQDLATESAEQTRQGAAQNRSLLIFTIVTIVFVSVIARCFDMVSAHLTLSQLPLGFFSSVFGMNAVEFGQGKFHIWWQILIMGEFFHLSLHG
jgi:Mg2+ and Co2+ transporter CorA